FFWEPFGVTRNGVAKRPHGRVGVIPEWSEKLGDESRLFCETGDEKWGGGLGFQIQCFYFLIFEI
ncbi:MAG: hypothetical protein WD989_00550, partial [Candidatus Paceibacterota bacterium]